MSNTHGYTPYVSAVVEAMMRKQDEQIIRKSGSAPTFGQLITLAGFNVFEAFAKWNRKRKIENEMQVLSDHMLADIGITRGDISKVAADAARLQTPTAVQRHRILSAKGAKIMAFKRPVAISSVAVTGNDEALKVA